MVDTTAADPLARLLAAAADPAVRAWLLRLMATAEASSGGRQAGDAE